MHSFSTLVGVEAPVACGLILFSGLKRGLVLEQNPAVPVRPEPFKRPRVRRLRRLPPDDHLRNDRDAREADAKPR